jgi:hypothetical protein
LLEGLGRVAAVGLLRFGAHEFLLQLAAKGGFFGLTLLRLGLTKLLLGLLLLAQDVRLALTRGLHALPNAADDPGRVAMEIGIAPHPHRVDLEQALQVIRERGDFGQQGVFDQHRDHGLSRAQRVGDLHADEVSRRVEPTDPHRTDERHDRVD